MPRNLLVASDLSLRSKPALQRALILRRAWQARLRVLHVVDADCLPEAAPEEERLAREALARDLAAPDATGATGDIDATDIDPPQILVRSGDPFEEILSAAEEAEAELIILGAHRKRRLLDMFIGTTAERVIRRGLRPTLMVHGEAVAPWRHVMLAVDMSEASLQAVRQVQALGVLDGAKVTLVHAFDPVARFSMSYTGMDDGRLRTYIDDARAEATRALRTFLQQVELEAAARTVLVEGNAPQAIAKAVADRGADLLVVGTKGASGIKRLVLGSVAEEILDSAAIDVLAVPTDPEVGK